jgi:hypothetical protein
MRGALAGAARAGVRERAALTSFGLSYLEWLVPAELDAVSV